MLFTEEKPVFFFSKLRLLVDVNFTQYMQIYTVQHYDILHQNESVITLTYCLKYCFL